MDIISDYPMASEVVMENNGTKSIKFASCIESLTRGLSATDIGLVVNHSGAEDAGQAARRVPGDGNLMGHSGHRC